MPNRPLSIIVIAYNEEEFVPGVLAALEVQMTRDFEVIVVDSNSTDGTERAARAHAARLPHFRYLRLSQTRGPAYGRNRGAEIAAHEHLLFLDADTVLDDGFIALTTAEMAELGADVGTCPLRVIEDSALSRLGAAFLNLSMQVFRPIYSSAYGACLFSSKKVHLAVNGFDERLGICEDCYYVKKARRLGFRFRILDPAFYTSDRRARHEGSLRVMAKYMGCHVRRLLTGREIMRETIHYDYGEF